MGTRVLFGVALCAIFAVTFASVALFRGREASTASVQHALRVVVELDGLMSAMRDAETGQRGFLLTARESYLEPYRAGARQVPDRIEAVRSALTGDATEQTRLERLEQILRAKLEELESTVRSMQAGRTSEALAVVSSDRGKSLMDEARALVGEMVDAQRQALVALEKEQRQLGLALVGSEGTRFTLVFPRRVPEPEPRPSGAGVVAPVPARTDSREATPPEHPKHVVLLAPVEA